MKTARIADPPRIRKPPKPANSARTLHAVDQQWLRKPGVSTARSPTKNEASSRMSIISILAAWIVSSRTLPAAIGSGSIKASHRGPTGIGKSWLASRWRRRHPDGSPVRISEPRAVPRTAVAHADGSIADPIRLSRIDALDDFHGSMKDAERPRLRSRTTLPAPLSDLPPDPVAHSRADPTHHPRQSTTPHHNAPRQKGESIARNGASPRESQYPPPSTPPPLIPERSPPQRPQNPNPAKKIPSPPKPPPPPSKRILIEGKGATQRHHQPPTPPIIPPHH